MPFIQTIGTYFSSGENFIYIIGFLSVFIIFGVGYAYLTSKFKSDGDQSHGFYIGKMFLFGIVYILVGLYTIWVSYPLFYDIAFNRDFSIFLILIKVFSVIFILLGGILLYFGWAESWT
ncbi:MAG: hypothetical protein JWO50_622 [Candidatus Kaiserbacteria bacterium]|nr:hypothetical protein [Candidatus Kaiserbacteria bacterium]